MIYKIRIIADIKEDVFRDIEIKKDDTLEDLHYAIIESFDLPKGNMASFIRCNENWEQLEEIPLENLKNDMIEDDDDDRPLPFSDKCMRHIKIEEILKNKADRLIYLSDFINMYNFHIELIDKKEEQKGIEYPLLVYQYGDSVLIFSQKKSEKHNLFDEEFGEEEWEDDDEEEEWEDEEEWEEEFEEDHEENEDKY